MQKHRLGKTDIEVSKLGLGTVKFGRNQGVKYPAPFTLPTDEQLKILLQETKNFGINLLDTAPAYGTSEERLGKLLHGQRHDWVITSKVGEEFINGMSHFDFSSSTVIKSIERSLKRLATDYLDILLVHSNGEDERIMNEYEIFATLSKLKDAGKIRAYGMSTKTVSGGLAAIEQSDLAMVTLNLQETEDRVVIQHAQQKQKGIFIKKAFASGHLQQLSTSDPIADSLNFIFSEPGVTSVIIGTINAEHLRESVQAVERHSNHL